jgi:murein DD-endopeptidase MepM/ murein hydrolase activator NlpD
MEKKTILIVPPRGVPVRSIRIRLSVVITFLILVTVGFTGYFIPFNRITLSDMEKNQKKNLTEQNSALLQKILSSLRLLNNLKEQVERLEMKKKNVLSKPVSDSAAGSAIRNRIDLSKMGTGELITLVRSREKRLRSFIAAASDSNKLFDILPVIAPVSEPYVISRKYGPSEDPFTGIQKWHYGIDFVAEEGSYVFATADGVIEKEENHPLWGKRIVISHGEGITTIFAHLGSFKINQGKRVSRGDIIGTIGTSGLSSGPHLHYEIRIDGNPLDPFAYMYPSIAGKVALILH